MPLRFLKQSALHRATRNDHIDVVRAILRKKGIDVNQKDDSDSTAAHYLCRRNDFSGDEVKSIFEQYAFDLSVIDKNGETLLHTATRSGHEDVAQWLIDEKGMGAQPNLH